MRCGDQGRVPHPSIIIHDRLLDVALDAAQHGRVDYVDQHPNRIGAVQFQRYLAIFVWRSKVEYERYLYSTQLIDAMSFSCETPQLKLESSAKFLL